MAAMGWPVLQWAGVAHAQPAARAGKPLRVGIFNIGTPEASGTEKAFIDTMRALGWVEGRNIVYDRVYADGDETRLPGLAVELVGRSPDLILASPYLPASVVLARTRRIPIVFGAVNDPVAYGLVQSLARPGGNITGIANLGWELGGKRMQLLKEATPKISRVAVLLTAHPESSKERQLIERAAGASVKVISAVANEPREVDAALASLAESRPEALLTTHIGLFLRERKRILQFAAKLRIPVIGHRFSFADDGALMSYSSNLFDQYRRAAHLADKVLKGTKPADIPVEQPTTFDLIVNLKTAKALGITIPQSILLQASRVIE